MKQSLKLLLIVAVVAVFSSCKKYEDGPSISLLSKTSRFANDWVIESIILNGVDVTAGSLMENYEITINKDGTYKDDAGTGTWEFASQKEEVIFDKGESYEWQLKILRLKSKELWLEDNSTADIMEIHYKQK